MNQNSSEKQANSFGIVTEALPNALFRVKLESASSTSLGGDDAIVLAYLAGKMRLHKIKVLIGDKVELVIDQYGGKARIVKRF